MRFEGRVVSRYVLDEHAKVFAVVSQTGIGLSFVTVFKEGIASATVPYPYTPETIDFLESLMGIPNYRKVYADAESMSKDRIFVIKKHSLRSEPGLNTVTCSKDNFQYRRNAKDSEFGEVLFEAGTLQELTEIYYSCWRELFGVDDGSKPISLLATVFYCVSDGKIKENPIEAELVERYSSSSVVKIEQSRKFVERFPPRNLEVAYHATTGDLAFDSKFIVLMRADPVLGPIVQGMEDETLVHPWLFPRHHPSLLQLIKEHNPVGWMIHPIPSKRYLICNYNGLERVCSDAELIDIN